MVGILCEKPSAARNFAKALGGMTGVFNGEDYKIVNARGHLYELAPPEGQVSASLSVQYKSWDLDKLPWNENDFQWKRVKIKDTSALLKNIKQALTGCDEIVIAGDIDSLGEGYLLCEEIIDELKLRPKQFTRMVFADESVKEIQKAFKTRQVVPDIHKHPEYLMAEYRSKFDFITMQFTRIASKCGDGKSVIRQGRLKSAMVVLVGDALKAVKEYKKIPYYQNRFKDENGVVYTNPNEPQYELKPDVPNKYKPSAVVCDSVTQKTTAPPKLIDLATLSARLASKGIKPKQVLATYQKMYESQIVSYPRTDDKVITIEQYNELLPKADEIARLIGVPVNLLTHRTPRKCHIGTGCAHGANRPGSKVPKSLDELKSYGVGAVEIYTMLAQSYLAILCEDYVYEQQKGHVKDYPDFVGSVNIPKSQGWKLVTQDDKTDDDMSAKGLGKMASPFIYEGFPPKPPTPTWLWLKTQLEKYDVGTGATRTSTYADVTNDKAKCPLLVDTRGKITMTRYGEMSYGLLPDTHIGSLGLTESMYKNAKAIAEGKRNTNDCLHELQQMVIDDIKTMQRNSVVMRKELNVMENNVEKEKAEGIWNGQEVKFNRTWSGHRFTDEEVDKLLAGEEIEVLGLVSAKGNTYGVKGKLAAQDYNGHSFIGFQRTGFADVKKVPDKWCGHKFTEDEKARLEMGNKIHIDGAISKKGNVFACDVTFGKTEKGSWGIIPQFN